MFNACRRGTASLTKIIRITPSRITSTAWPFSIQKQCSHPTRLFSTSLQIRSAQTAPRVAPKTQENSQLITRFDELVQHNLVHPNVVKAVIQGMGHETMTEVQTLTINEALQGIDM